MLKKLIAAVVLVPAILLGTTVPAQAATTIHSMTFRGYAYFPGLGTQPAIWYWIDYNWAEERFQGKRDCYCDGPHLMIR